MAKVSWLWRVPLSCVGTTKEELRHSARDVTFGMLFSNIVMYFIILSTAATLFHGQLAGDEYSGLGYDGDDLCGCGWTSARDVVLRV
jgi:hypothetical protein